MRLEMAFVNNIFQFNPVCSLIFNYLSRLMVNSLTNTRFIQSPSRLESPFQMLSTGSLPEKKERIFKIRPVRQKNFTYIQKCHFWMVLPRDDQHEVTGAVKEPQGSRQLAVCEAVKSQMHLRGRGERKGQVNILALH